MGKNVSFILSVNYHSKLFLQLNHSSEIKFCKIITIKLQLSSEQKKMFEVQQRVSVREILLNTAFQFSDVTFLQYFNYFC